MALETRLRCVCAPGCLRAQVRLAGARRATYTRKMGFAIKVVIVLIVAAGGALAARRMAAAARAPISDDECVSCGSSDVQVQGAGAYVCSACGYEGGSGRAEMARQSQADKYAALSPQERQRVVTDHVRTAARILASYSADLTASKVVQNLVDGDVPVFDISTSSVAGDLANAAAELRLAETVAGGPIVLANGLTVDAKGVSASLMASREGMLSIVKMQTTGAEASGYLTAVLAGLDEAGSASPPG